ncbi:hypothetical protein PIB30_001183 [Stylosanthes scabra]|uniref:Uncharacterized protein n=1 Tax=Stylosanthes scabra TaxID=79078 RepID=A0ABU6V1P4_9FABA|nr:hypothetical protein [Stylosanthes scabra]
MKAEKELSAALDQIEVLKGERDSAFLYLPLKEKVDNLDDQLSERTAEYRSALDRIALLEEDNRGEKKRSEVAEEQVGSLDASLKALEASEYWRAEWRQLGTEVTGRRIFIPQESDVEEERPQAGEAVPEQHPGITIQASQSAAGDVAGVSGECPTENFSAPGDQSGVVPWCLFRPLYGLLFGLILKP